MSDIPELSPIKERHHDPKLCIYPTLHTPFPKSQVPARCFNPTFLSWFIQLSAEIKPPAIPYISGFFARKNKAPLLSSLKSQAAQLKQLPGVERVDIYDAVMILNPFEQAHLQYLGMARPARFDMVALIETDSPYSALTLQQDPSFSNFQRQLYANAKRVHTLTATNSKRMNDVDRSKPGLFLFNYFKAQNAQQAPEFWTHEAGAYKKETGLDNSILLTPLPNTPSEFTMVNHARWDKSLFNLFWIHATRPSFRRFVQNNQQASGVVAMPAFYRLA